MYWFAWKEIKKKEFALDEVYGFEAYLQAKHSSNNNIRRNKTAITAFER